MKKNSYLYFFILSAIFILIDQLIKLLIIRIYPEIIIANEKIFFDIIYNGSELLMAFALIAFFIFVIREFKSEKSMNYKSITALSLIFSGGLSNLIDRLERGAVIDYLNLYFWRINLADIYILAGIIIYLIMIFKNQKKKFKSITHS